MVAGLPRGVSHKPGAGWKYFGSGRVKNSRSIFYCSQFLHHYFPAVLDTDKVPGSCRVALVSDPLDFLVLGLGLSRIHQRSKNILYMNIKVIWDLSVMKTFWRKRPVQPRLFIVRSIPDVGARPLEPPPTALSDRTWPVPSSSVKKLVPVIISGWARLLADIRYRY